MLKNKLKQAFKKKKFWYLFILLAGIALYHLPYFNRFAPIQEGWFHTYAQAVLDGKIPYRDFYFFLPPLYLFLYAGFIHIFGPTFIAQRIYGIIERLGMNIVLFSTLTKYFKPSAAAFACFTAFILYANHNTDVIYSYYQTAMLFSLICVWALSRYKLSLPLNKRALLLITTGVFAALAFLIKQTTGVFTFAFILSYLFLILLRKKPKAIPFAFAYVLLPAIAVITLAGAFLYRNQALSLCIQQVFASGIESKGSLFTVLTGFYQTTFTVPQTIIFCALSVLWTLLKIMPRKLKIKLHPLREKIYLPVFILFCGIFSISVCYANIAFIKIAIVHFIFYTSFLIGLWYSCNAFKRELTGRESFYLLLSGASFALMYSHGLSCTLEEHSALLGGAFLVSLMLKTKIQFNKAKNYALIIFFSIFTFFLINHRYQRPYEWWGDKEASIYEANTTVDIPSLKGIKMSASQAASFKEIDTLIRQNIKTPEDKIYIGPHLTGRYFTAGVKPFTFAYTDYFDVCSDTCARLNAAAIKQVKPKMIIYMDFYEYIWLEHETLFRGSKPSGQRDIQKVIKEISPDYILLKKYNISKSFLDSDTLYIWLRKDAAPKEQK